jgi:Protein of unknown function (DUF2490)
MKKIMFTLCIAISFTLTSFGQYHQTTDNFGMWFNYHGSHKFADKWGWHLEGSLRQTNFIGNTNQLFFRTGLIYYLNSAVSFTGGYAFAQSNPYGEFPVKASFPEHRIWEQVQIKTQLNATEWVSRFRLEQRFSFQPIPDGAGGYKAADTPTYTNRFRLSNKFAVPFKGKTIEDKSVYAYVSDEFFINFGDNIKANFLDQNRLAAGLGYKIPHLGKLECGYMLQTFFKSDGIKIQHDHNVVMTLSSNISFMKKKK